MEDLIQRKFHLSLNSLFTTPVCFHYGFFPVELVWLPFVPLGQRLPAQFYDGGGQQWRRIFILLSFPPIGFEVEGSIHILDSVNLRLFGVLHLQSAFVLRLEVAAGNVWEFEFGFSLFPCVGWMPGSELM